MLQLLVALALQEEIEGPVPAIEPQSRILLDVRAGAGAWNPGGFDALTAGGVREIESDLLAEADLELGLDWDGWSLHLGGATAGTGDLQGLLGWLRVSSPSLIPAELSFPLAPRVSAGPLAGRIEANDSGFGDFEAGVGFLARVALESPANAELTWALWAEYRALEFDYEEDVLSGDDSLGSRGFAFGLTAGLRF